MSLVEDVARAVRREDATKRRLIARCASLPIGFAMDARVETMSSKELATVVLNKLGFATAGADPVLALDSFLAGRESALRGAQGRPGVGMDAAPAKSFVDKYLEE